MSQDWQYIPRRRLRVSEAPVCDSCGARYTARNSYASTTRYQRSCDCEGEPFARFVSRPIDESKLSQLDLIYLAQA
ncbi:MAG: hypothetical protein AAF958_14730 [Planctomycetota bacterium]